jgi:hypothetical protein
MPSMQGRFQGPRFGKGGGQRRMGVKSHVGQGQRRGIKDVRNVANTRGVKANSGALGNKSYQRTFQKSMLQK